MKRILVVVALALALAVGSLMPSPASAHTGWHPTSTTYCSGHTMYVLYQYYFWSASGGYHYGPVDSAWFSASSC